MPKRGHLSLFGRALGAAKEHLVCMAQAANPSSQQDKSGRETALNGRMEE